MLELSLLCFNRLQKEESLKKILPLVDSIHLDIMDGKFVKNTAFSVQEVNELNFNLPKHVHVMAFNSEEIIDALKPVPSISFHFEAEEDPLNLIKKIQSKKIKAGLCINPETSVDEVADLLPLLDRIVVMAVYPGFSGQKYLPETSEKIRVIRAFDSKIEIVIDGGMREETIEEVLSLGANACVVCSVIVKASDPLEKTEKLKKIPTLVKTI